MDRAAGRRAFVAAMARGAGVASALVPVMTGESSPLVQGDETDVRIIAASLMLEHHAIALYDHGLKEGLVPPGLRDYAVEFRGDHIGHRDTQVAIAEERGGKAPLPLPAYEFQGLSAGDDFLRACLAIERTAQDAYAGLIASIRSGDYLLSAAFILVDEARHVTVWQRVLGQRIY